MAGTGLLIARILLAGTIHDWFEGEALSGGFGKQLVGGDFAFSARDHPDIPKGLALLRYQDSITHLQVNHLVEESQAQGQVILIGDGVGKRQGIWSAVAGLTAGVLGVLLAAVDMTITHRFLAGVAVDAVQFVLALCELRNRLVIVLEPVDRVVGSRMELQICQAVVAAVVAGIALCIRHGGGQLVHLGAVITRGGAVAG